MKQHETQWFSQAEARSEVGRYVRLLVDFYPYKAGTRGVVVGVHDSEVLGPVFEVALKDAGDLHQSFTKDAYDFAFAQEIERIH